MFIWISANCLGFCAQSMAQGRTRLLTWKRRDAVIIMRGRGARGSRGPNRSPEAESPSFRVRRSGDSCRTDIRNVGMSPAFRVHRRIGLVVFAKNSFAGTDTTGHKPSRNWRTSARIPPKTGMRCRSSIRASCMATPPGVVVIMIRGGSVPQGRATDRPRPC